MTDIQLVPNKCLLMHRKLKSLPLLPLCVGQSWVLGEKKKKH